MNPIVGIYLIVLESDGRCYVGQSVNVRKRLNEHRNKLRKDIHYSTILQNAWNKHGEEAFTFELLEECLESDLNTREQFWIDELVPYFNTAPIAGTRRGVPQSAATRLKMSIAHKGVPKSEEHKAAIGAAHKGRVHTEEARQKMSATRKGRTLSPEHRAKLSIAGKGRKPSPESIAKGAEKRTGQKRTPEQRQRMSDAQTARYERERMEKQPTEEQ